jgi:TolA-binding protein
MILDSAGAERHRFEGFLPVDDYLAQLELGLAKLAFAHGEFGDAEKRFRALLERFPESEAAPEALYWAGVSKYKATDDSAALAETGEAFRSRYSETSWAKKSSVWVQESVGRGSRGSKQ